MKLIYPEERTSESWLTKLTWVELLLFTTVLFTRPSSITIMIGSESKFKRFEILLTKKNNITEGWDDGDLAVQQLFLRERFPL